VDSNILYPPNAAIPQLQIKGVDITLFGKPRQPQSFSVEGRAARPPEWWVFNPAYSVSHYNRSYARKAKINLL